MSYDRQPMPPQVAPDLVRRLAQTETSTLGHWRLWGICAPELRPLKPTMKACGTVVTLALPGPDGALLHEALSCLRKGDVLAIDRLGDTLHAAVGRGRRRCGGQGACRDRRRWSGHGSLRNPRNGLPVWSRGVSAKTTRRLGLGGRFNAAVNIGGAVAHPGDLALCDGDGVVFVSTQEAEDDIDRAIRSAHRERTIRDGLAQGNMLEGLLEQLVLAGGL
jgi:regulator of RNase E activity RraA